MTNVLYDGVFAPHAASEKVFCSPTGEISYAAFTQMTNRLANCLIKNGLQSGDGIGGTG